MNGPRSVEKSGRSVEEALQAALDDLGARRDEVDVEVLDEPSKGLWGFLSARLARIRVTRREPTRAPAGEDGGQASRRAEDGAEGEAAGPAPGAADGVDGAPDELEAARVAAPIDPEEARARLERAKGFVSEAVRHMGVTGYVETRRIDDSLYTLNVVTEQAGLLVGRRGQVLDALQYLTNVAVNRHGQGGGWLRVVLDAGDYRKRRESVLRSLALRVARRVRQEGRRVTLEPMNALERRIIHLTLREERGVHTLSEGEEPFRRVVVFPGEREGDTPARASGASVERRGPERGGRPGRRPHAGSGWPRGPVGAPGRRERE